MGPSTAKGLSRQVAKLLGFYSRPLAAPVDPLCKEPTLKTPPCTLSSERYFARGNQELAHLNRSVAWNYLTSRGLYSRHVSQLAANEGKKVILVDTLALVRKLESQGFTGSQAEALTAAMTDVLNGCLESVAQSFVSRSDLQKSDMMLEAALSKLKADVRTSQETRTTSIQRETENLHTDIDKLRSEMRYEMEKVTAGQRLDLNLERGRMRDELAKQSTETSNLTNKLNKEINALKTQLEASKFEVIKYCIGTIVSVLALGLGLLRVFK